MAKPKSNEVLNQVRQIVGQWQLARGATYTNGGVGDDISEKIALPDDHGRSPPKDVLARETQTYDLPTDVMALFKIEEALGMTPKKPLRVSLRRKYENWIAMPPAPSEPQ